MAESVQPLVQPPVEDLRNALQVCAGSIAEWPHSSAEHDRARLEQELKVVARLIRHALDQLGEPNLAAMQAGEILVREWNGSFADQRNIRDVVAGILHAQLTGEIPPTWGTP